MLQCDPPCTDIELLEMLKQGDTTAFDTIYQRYWKFLFTAAFNRLNDEDLAKDIVQTLFIDLWQKRDALEITTGLKPYLSGAVKFKVLQYFRSEHYKQNVMQVALERMYNLGYSYEDLSAYIDLEKMIDEEVEEMPDNMKQAFLMRNDDYSVKEIAKNLNLAEQTVSNNISGALKRLKLKLKVQYPHRYFCLVGLFITVFTKS